MIKKEEHKITGKEYHKIKEVMTIKCNYNTERHLAMAIVEYKDQNNEICTITVFNQLKEVVQPERLSEESTIKNKICIKCGRGILYCTCDSPK